MKYLLIFLLLLSTHSFAQENSEGQWEGLDLEQTQMEEIRKQKQVYEGREGDLQIQAEEEEIIPIESEDTRNFELENNDD